MSIYAFVLAKARRSVAINRLCQEVCIVRNTCRIPGAGSSGHVFRCRHDTRRQATTRLRSATENQRVGRADQCLFVYLFEGKGEFDCNVEELPISGKLPKVEISTEP